MDAAGSLLLIKQVRGNNLSERNECMRHAYYFWKARSISRLTAAAVISSANYCDREF